LFLSFGLSAGIVFSISYIHQKKDSTMRPTEPPTSVRLT
jgi:hypothetical protein